MLFVNALLFCDDGVFRAGGLRTEGEKIVETGLLSPLPGEEVIDCGGKKLLPGFVDIHTHGAMGEDFSDGKPAGLQPLADYYAAHGITSYLATTMTLKEETLTPAMHAIRDFKPAKGAKCAGVHLEGPFLCYAKRGAQAAENLHKPDTALFHRLNEASGGQVKMVTVACEEENALSFIREVSQICAVSLGHTTADYDTAMAGFAAGATHATHLYNAMNPLNHRSPGLIGAAADNANCMAELICDGIHVHESMVRAAFKLFPGRIALISDSMRATGLEDGTYDLGGQNVTVKERLATLENGTIAGSATNVFDCMKNAISFGIPLEEAIAAATINPANSIGIFDHTGSLTPGKRADVILLDKDLNLVKVI